MDRQRIWMAQLVTNVDSNCYCRRLATSCEATVLWEPVTTWHVCLLLQAAQQLDPDPGLTVKCTHEKPRTSNMEVKGHNKINTDQAGTATIQITVSCLTAHQLSQASTQTRAQVGDVNNPPMV